MRFVIFLLICFIKVISFMSVMVFLLIPYCDSAKNCRYLEGSRCIFLTNRSHCILCNIFFNIFFRNRYYLWQFIIPPKIFFFEKRYYEQFCLRSPIPIFLKFQLKLLGVYLNLETKTGFLWSRIYADPIIDK